MFGNVGCAGRDGRNDQVVEKIARSLEKFGTVARRRGQRIRLGSRKFGNVAEEASAVLQVVGSFAVYLFWFLLFYFFAFVFVCVV